MSGAVAPSSGMKYPYTVSPASISSSVSPAARRNSSDGSSSTSITTFSRCRAISSGRVSMARRTTAANVFMLMPIPPC
jgi:hypothetical protein